MGTLARSGADDSWYTTHVSTSWPAALALASASSTIFLKSMDLAPRWQEVAVMTIWQEEREGEGGDCSQQKLGAAVLQLDLPTLHLTTPPQLHRPECLLDVGGCHFGGACRRVWGTWAHGVTLGLLSRMRPARDSAEKPPKTTECTAPMRVHASMVAGSSISIGMYSVTSSPFLMPFAFSMLAIWQTMEHRAE